MISFNLLPMMTLRSISGSKRQFLIGLGINHMSADKLLRGEMTALRLDQIEKICLALRCTPNDLLEWTPDSNRVVDEAHPLHQLTQGENMENLLQKMSKLSPKELEERMGDGV
ncbi:MAG: helix-turn-helix transcriptional regulator [Bacteroidia bacterium]|nr:helix-turn-helix transcriptional regulator [Bacteroidia bacterium]